jgi:RNA polymerase sigma factor (sigma-70 family)
MAIEPAEVERLYAAFYPLVRGYARKLIGRDGLDISEDLTQDAWLRLWELISAGEWAPVDDGHFRAAWLQGVRFRWGEHVGRLRTRQEELVAELDVDENAFVRLADSRSRGPSAESTLMGWLGGPAVEALRRVNPPGRAILVKKIVEGYTAEEIAEEFGYASTSKASYAIEAARRELREAYAAVAHVPVPVPCRHQVDRCRRGHEWTAVNTMVRSNGQRTCRTCKRETALRRGAERTEHAREYSREYMRRRRREADLTHRIDPDDVLRAVHA